MVDDRGVTHPGSTTNRAVLLLLVCLLSVNTAEGGTIATLQAYQACLESPVTYTRFDHDSSGLTGIIPSELGRMTALTFLDIGYNQLSGTIPSELAAMTLLTELSLRVRNQLTGSIPSADLASLTSLGTLYLNNNQLSGRIPSELAALSGLSFVLLNNAGLCGVVPTGVKLYTGNAGRPHKGTDLGNECPTPSPFSSSATTTSRIALPTSSLAAFGALGGVAVCVIIAAVGSSRSDGK